MFGRGYNIITVVSLFSMPESSMNGSFMLFPDAINIALLSFFSDEIYFSISRYFPLASTGYSCMLI